MLQGESELSFFSKTRGRHHRLESEKLERSDKSHPQTAPLRGRGLSFLFYFPPHLRKVRGSLALAGRGGVEFCFDFE
ncbi:MAG: hypothetical protein A2431_03805 [Candidatus Zambryskibacteria bacterium RIFOXYC1_FULL_39_10]|uniref:Uncharacterized protein n=1 Tax=Candidatus Zambryskibacteria bacterium RIFOXYC1_FULL_39_10 TaxID=1802779 RepID=A0A1G2V195_9BACT|nr:MAG: hypothetical protein A2431_03805 [Candidatus Zambryskibacteria bacterium RIFOXYC1_FULL_39_10]OHB16474.1 MAG: hypothetical protein A2605_01510 [Candidatus Zambryskibacteria bacterium RIFOXYD1_FULL_39_35]